MNFYYMREKNPHWNCLKKKLEVTSTSILAKLAWA